MSILRPPAAQQNDVREWLRSIHAILSKWFAGGKLTVTPGSVVGQMSRRGQATVANAATSVVVTHGCGFTPTLQQIAITLGNSPTNAIGVPYVDTIGATQFTIHCADPGAAGATFGWQVLL